ncbi:MAG TPA: hypothetical protein VF178_03450 [Gemmatimonadaceae bacterium]
MEQHAPSGSRRTPSPIVELRQYTLLPGKRDVLIDIFEREFIEWQEAVGIEVIDHFRDLDDPDRFVWLRGFPDLPTRATANEAFYAGEVFRRNRDTANAVLVDYTNVLLLRPAGPAWVYPTDGERPPAGVTGGPTCLVVATIYQLDPAAEAEFPAFFETSVAPELTACGATTLAAYATEHSPNNYPRLAIREGEHVFVWFSRFADVAAYERHLTGLARSPRWRGEIEPALAQRIKGTPEVRRLVPTARSRTRA